MKRRFLATIALIVFGIGLAPALQAEPIPDNAYDHALAPAEAQRLMRMLMKWSQASEDAATGNYKERQNNSAQLRTQLYSPTPDLAVIERLYQRERQLQREDQARTERLSDGFMQSLSTDDRVKYLKLMFPLPVTTARPPEQSPSKQKQ